MRNLYRSDIIMTHLTSPPVPQNHSIISASQVILNDTSLAALFLANGDRHLFFQDNAALIQRVVRTASNNRWSTSKNQNLSLSSNPKYYTPLTATVNDHSEVLIRLYPLRGYYAS